MFKTVQNRVWAFDLEWVPDPFAGRLLHGLDESLTDPEEIMRVMWTKGGATDDDPTPFLKTALCRVVSVAAVERRSRADGGVTVSLVSLPHDVTDAAQTAEMSVVGAFLDALGAKRPQLVGFNSLFSDIKILIQRGVLLGLTAPGFCARPDKPWEGIDYFARGSDWNIDLKEILGGYGLANPSLHEVAVQSGIPGKMEVDGNAVARLWLDGELEKIVEYNEFDALTTYLVWLRVAHFGGHFSDSGYAEEQQRVTDLILAEIDGGRTHLKDYLDEWQRLREAVATREREMET
jgi:predicted PolB exonuclease-like 3'-5' exonuclease